MPIASNYAFERAVPRGQVAPRALGKCMPASLIQAACPAAQRER